MAVDSVGDTSLLLGSQDVPPVLEENAAGRSPFLVTCDHYGRLIPEALGDLGLPESELSRHIAWDIGIAGVAERLSKQLDAHLIAQRYSRLVIDCNRPPGAASSIPVISEATAVPGNEGLSNESKEIRRREIFDPYHRRIDEVIGQPLGNAGNADVPGDVAFELARGHTEIAERVRNDPAVVITGEKKGRIAVRIIFMHRRNIRRRQK